ncbi:hypothetical protein ABFA07_003288 [Porites harrisoni]
MISSKLTAKDLTHLCNPSKESRLNTGTGRKTGGKDPSHQMTENDINDDKLQLPDGIGIKWKELARVLDYKNAIIEAIEKEKGSSTKECCIDLLVRWIGREGSEATAGRLADALEKIERKNLADNLIRGFRSCECTDCVTQRSVEFNVSNEPIQIACHCNKCDKMVSEISDQLRVSIREEVLRTNTEIKELKQELSTEQKKRQEAEEKVLRTNTEIKELKEEVSTERKKRQEAEEKGSILRARNNELEEQVLRMGTRIEKLEKKSLVAQEKDRFDTKQEDKDLESREGRVSPVAKPHILTIPCTSVHTMFFCILL